jgi:hypothetical protein
MSPLKLNNSTIMNTTENEDDEISKNSKNDYKNGQ